MGSEMCIRDREIGSEKVPEAIVLEHILAHFETKVRKAELDKLERIYNRAWSCTCVSICC